MKQIALNFIDSEDVREHLEKIRYEFSSAETAFFIGHSHTSTLSERLDAFQEIIRTMPDCKIAMRPNFHPCISLHDLIRDYMKYQNDLVAILKSEDGNHVYRLSALQHNEIFEISAYFRSLDDCIVYAKWLIKNAKLDYEEPEYKEFYISCHSFHRFDQDEYSVMSQIVATYNNMLELLSISYHGQDDEHELSLDARRLENVFGGLWFDIPIPFKKGDIVINPYDENNREPMVFIGNVTDRNEKQTDDEYQTFLKRLQTDSDDSDMSFHAAIVSRVPGYPIWEDDFRFNFELEYYHGELNGKQRLLKTISSYYHGEISEALFACAVSQINFESIVNPASMCFGWYTDKERQESGLLE